jgi:outer membrane biosynthesis protein TonB
MPAMVSESLTPPPSSSGGPAKYLVILLLLLGGGLGVYLATSGGESKRPPPEPKSPERSTALTQDTVQIPIEEEEDAAVPPPEEPEVKRHVRAGGDPWACQGELPAADIKKVLGDQQASVRSCYERALRNDNQLQGSVNIEVRIGNDGKVSQTRVQGSLRNPDVSKCVQNLAKNWVFHSPSGGTCAVFAQKYNFTPKH